MKYRIDRENYHSFDVVHKNKLPPRSYFIPFESRQQADDAGLLEKRYVSPKVTCLNGLWDFRFYPQPGQMPEEFDTEKVIFDTIDVPSCWQFRGYDQPFYVNTRYLFPFDPPNIPREDPVGKVFSWTGVDQGNKPRWLIPENQYNFVGVYRRRLDIQDLSKEYIISFLGVASCMDLYANGSFVGYSEGSHNTAEFNLTPYLVCGENELLVVVHRWCTGSYLECQDMFRNNGIFRDVLLYTMEPTDIWDLSIHSVRDGDGYCAFVGITVQGNSDVKITISGHGLEASQVIANATGRQVARFENLKVRQWNAEEPVLYDLYAQMPGVCVKLRVGFKDIRIQKDVYTLNGKKLKFRGVNHHDTSPINGYYLTPEEIARDVRLCKEHNIDSIRTSHYPPDPLLLELCDEMGIYVVDEADLETHGTFSQQLPPTYNTLTHNEAWKPRYLERVQRLYGRDKNHVSIVMWSLGNESGGYRNTDAMYDWLKEKTAIPIHYESAIHSRRIAYDVGSEMYPAVEKVRLVGLHRRRQRKLNTRPYFLCEYAHAMGVGPGAIEEYWQQIYQFDNLMGGCVWEMVDHAVLHPDGRYTYGGDHGEWEHDGNFCVDGLFYPDRTPSTGAKLVAHTYRPIRVRKTGDGRFEIFNTMAFSHSSRYEIQFRYPDGTIELPEIDVAPLAKAYLPISENGQDSVTVVVTDLTNGREVSREQIILRETELPNPTVLPKVPDGVEYVDGRIIVTVKGKKLEPSRHQTILFRAPTDNDTDLIGRCAMDGYTIQEEVLDYVRVENNRVCAYYILRCGKNSFTCMDTYESCAEGILVTSTLRPMKAKGNLPRFGKAYRLDERFDRVDYLGRNGESYCDMYAHTQIEKVTCRVEDMTEPNIRPQESGNRCDCHWVKLSDGETDITFTAVEKPFELGIKPYSDWELLSMKHREDEKRSGTYVTISAFQMGIGTGSCGPSTRPEYCFDANEEYVLKFIIS